MTSSRPTTIAPVSVIMPAYNNAETIGRALASIARQSQVPAQVVVVDDGSTDDTFNVAESWSERLNGAQLVVCRQENLGAGAARNNALNLADQEFVAFLDADDEWLPEKIERSLVHMAEPLSFVSHDMIMVAPGGESVANCHRHFDNADNHFRALMLRGFVATSTVVARRRAILEVGGFEPSLRAAQDYDLWLSLAERGSFRVFPQALTRYHVNPSGITANVERRRQCSVAVLRRHRAALGPGGLPIVLQRSLIIQYEAYAGWRAQGRHLKAGIEIFRVPSTLLAAVLV